VFKKDLDAARADDRIIEYPGAVHPTLKPQSWARSSTCRCGTMLKWTSKRRRRRQHFSRRTFASSARR
jgi:hypothetical protein